MNRYEKLGRAMIGYMIAFIGTFAFSATCAVFINLFVPCTPWDTLTTCSMMGTFFGFLGGALGWTSEF